MINSYFNITVIAEWCTFIASLILLDRKTTYWRLFIPLLFLVLCTETAGWYMYVYLKHSQNALPFNFLMLISNLFMVYFFSRAEALQPIKKGLKVAAMVFLVFGVGNLLFFQGPATYNNFSESLGDIILSLVCCYFLFTIIRSDEHIYLLKFDYFWLANGVLFYSLGSALLYQFSYVLDDYYRETNINVGELINATLNVFLNCSFIVAFVCRRKTTR